MCSSDLLQRQVVVWVQANRPLLDLFRARAMANFGSFLNEAGQRTEALAPTEEAVRILRQLPGGNPEQQRFLGLALDNLGVFYKRLGRHQEALAPTLEAVEIYRRLATTDPAFLNGLAGSLTNLSIAVRGFTACSAPWRWPGPAPPC